MRTPVPPGPYGGNPPGWERSVRREDLRFRVTAAVGDQPLGRAINAVSAGLLAIQQDAIAALESGVAQRLMHWLMEDISTADELFWKHAGEIEQRLILRRDAPAHADDVEQQVATLERFAAQLDEARTALRRLRPGTLDGSPALTEARASIRTLAGMARQLRRSLPRG